MESYRRNERILCRLFITVVAITEKGTDWRQGVLSTYNGQQLGLYTQRMIRNHQFKYIWSTTDVDGLYNLKKDPAELLMGKRSLR